MPKVKTFPASTTPKPRQSSFFVVTDGKKRVLIPRPKTYQAATAAALRHFPHMDGLVTFQTDELDVCAGQFTDISPDIWELAIETISSVLIKAEPMPDNVKLPVTAAADHRGTISVVVCLSHDPEYSSQRMVVRPTTDFGKIKAAALQAFGKTGCPDDYRLTYDGGYPHLNDTLAGWDIEDGDTIDLFPVLKGGKPVIYLYSPHVVDASVRLTLTREWDLSVVYPWDVRTHPDGSLTEHTTGLDAAYVFWEALYLLYSNTNHEIPISPPASPVLGQPAPASFSPTTCDLTPADSVLLAVNEITPYLDAALRAMALHTEARTSFITYWLPALLKHQRVALRFVPQAEYETAARLDITPRPDVVTRVFMVFNV
ncbi:hypothetical protein C8R44DRAFT_878737 [Mycena epipterygia]|nr:hypothetical protein C8R44DRAFT_878737 [Mycena epipterygia]